MKKMRKIFRCRRGASAVEFALVAPVFLLLIAVIFEFGRVMWIKNTMQYAVEEAGRYAMVNSTAIIANSISYEIYIQNTLGPSKVVGAFSSDVSFTTLYDALTDPNAITMQITANYTYAPLVSIIPSVSVPLSAMSKVPLNP